MRNELSLIFWGTMENPSLFKLPEELLVMIFETLTPKERLKVSEVSSRLRNVMGDSRYWSRCRLASRFPLLGELSLDYADVAERIIVPIEQSTADYDQRIVKLIDRISNEGSVPSDLFKLMTTATTTVWSVKKGRLNGIIGPASRDVVYAPPPYRRRIQERNEDRLHGVIGPACHW